MGATLADLLRGLPDEGLAALLRLRPDLIAPVPADIAALAARVQSRTSVARTLDRLDRFHLEILDALRLARDPDGLASVDAVLALAGTPDGSPNAALVRAAVQRLRAYLLVYGDEDAFQLVAAVDEVCGPYPAGLGRPAQELDPAAQELVADPARLRRTVLAAPPAARAVLDRLAAGPPVGTVTAGTESPVGWLVSQGLLVATSDSTVELPREVALLLRRDTGPLGQLHPAAPQPQGAPLRLDKVDSAGAGQAMEVVRHVEALLEALAADPAPVLRSGGLGIRDLRRLARTAGLSEPVAVLLTETAYAAGLIGDVELGGTVGRINGDREFRPAAGYDTWRSAAIAARWQQLATGWLAMTRQPGLAGSRDDKDRLLLALSPEVERSAAPASRHTTLGVLAGLPPGTAPSTDEVMEIVAWHAPRRAARWSTSVRQLLEEAATLGITGLGALTSYGRQLLRDVTAPAEIDTDPLGRLAPDAPAGLCGAAALLDALLPEPVHHVLVQADLTVVVPGPPEPTLAAELELVAEHESAGGASVHRVTRGSVRRAMDTGYAAEDLHALFARRSRTPVPQALSYLIDDVARAHGGLRVGSAGSYLRSEDQALVTQVLADRRLAPVGLRRLAPTVLVAGVPAGRLLSALRDAGYAPVPEDPSGSVVLTRPRARRAPARGAVPPPADPFLAARASTPRLLGIVEDLRRGDAAARARRAVSRVIGPAARTTNGQSVTSAQAHTEALAVLQQAVRDRARVWIGYIDSHGTNTSRLLRPVSIGAGYLRAEDERTATLHTFALHRITAATVDD